MEEYDLKKPESEEIVERLEYYRSRYSERVLKRGVYDSNGMVGEDCLNLVIFNELLEVGGLQIMALLRDLKREYGDSLEQGDFFAQVGKIGRYIERKTKEESQREDMKIRRKLEAIAKNGI